MNPVMDELKKRYLNPAKEYYREVKRYDEYQGSQRIGADEQSQMSQQDFMTPEKSMQITSHE